jgi:hypothetical protein
MSTPSTWPDGATSRANALARLQLRPIGHKVGDRLEQHVLRRLTIGPALAGGTVPVGDLVGVLVVGMRDVHMRQTPLNVEGQCVGSFAFAGPNIAILAPAPRD